MDKRVLCINLADTLRETYEFRNLKSIVYHEVTEGNLVVDEIATVWLNNDHFHVNVTCLGGFQMVRAIVEECNEYLFRRG